MSSDDYFDDDLDDDVLSRVDAIEAAHTQASVPSAGRSEPAGPPQRALPPRAAPPTQEVIDVDDTYDFDTLDDIELQAIDEICDQALNGKPAQPTAGSSRATSALHRTTSAATVQTTLFGGIVQNANPSRNGTAATSRTTVQRHNSRSNNIFTGKPNKTKKWDHTAFAKSGWKKPKTVKGKEKAGSFEDGEEDGWEEEDEGVEFEQFPAPFISLG